MDVDVSRSSFQNRNTTVSKVELLLPQFFPSTWHQELGVFGVDFVSGVSIGFVVREDNGFVFLLADEIETLSVGVTELLPKALANLSQLREASIKIAYPENATVAWLESNDNFSSIRMLLPEVRAKLAEKLGPEFLFTIPSRDLCFFWTAKASKENYVKFAAEAQEDFESEEYNLSPGVFVFSEKWPCEQFFTSV